MKTTIELPDDLFQRAAAHPGYELTADLEELNKRRRFLERLRVDNMERLKRLTAYSPVFNTITQGANVDIQVERKS